MRLRHVIAASAATLALGLGAPAFAQTTGVDEDGPGSADHNTVVDDTANDFLDLLSNNGNGNNRDNDANDNGNNRENETLISSGYTASRGGEVDVQYGSNVVADQELTAVNINMFLDEVVDLDGEDDTDTAVGYNSGQNQIRGNAFAAYAGILNQAWNTGINANTQAATNIAAQGTVNFGSDGAAADPGGDGGD